mgnify:CR=1 FL=1
MLANLAATLLLGFAGCVAQAPAKKGALSDPSSLRADFNAAKGVPRVVIILSPS